MRSAVEVFAPVPDFRYVWLEPLPRKKLGVAATALFLGGGVSLAMHGAGGRAAMVAGAVASLMSALALRGAATPPAPAAGGTRMAIVPWGVIVEAEESPRVLRWAAVRHVEVITSKVRSWPRLFETSETSSRVSVETEHDRLVGVAIGAVRLERLIENLDAYASEQAAPLALDLDGERAAEALEPECETLLSSVATWLESARAHERLSLPPAGYRRASSRAASSRATEVLRRILRDRRPKAADPRAFAAVVAAELRATELVPELVALTQCPHPLVAAFAKQAARKLGAPSAKTGTVDELAPFLTWLSDRARLDAWAKGNVSLAPA